MATLPNLASWQFTNYTQSLANTIVAWYGVPLPPGISQIQVYYDPATDQKIVGWCRRGKPHSMPLPELSDEYEIVMAVAVAMRMSE